MKSSYFYHPTIIGECVSLEYQSTGPMGGNHSHGGRTELNIKIDGGDLHCSFCEKTQTMRFVALGDLEMYGLDMALMRIGLYLAQRKLDKQYFENDKE